jgi:myo-inositol-1(or 4)-monophosphatase
MTLERDLQQDVMRVAHLLADAARPETLRLFRTQGLASADKAQADQIFDPVTEADRAA